MDSSYKRNSGAKSEYYIPEINKWVNNKHLKHTLEKLGMTVKWYYNKYFLGINDPDYVPKCSNPNCNNLVTGFSMKRGHNKYCCLSCQSKSNWMNDEFRNKQMKNNPTHCSGGLMSYIKSDPDRYNNWRSKSPGCGDGGLHKFLVDNGYRKYINLLNDGGSFGRLYNSDDPDVSMPNSLKSIYKTGVYVSSKCNKEVRYRSSYELRYLEILDNDDSVVSFSYECVRIPYEGPDKKIHRYVVDFLVILGTGEKLLVEVKPKYFLNDDIVMRKIEAGRRYSENNGFIYKIVTEDELQ